MFGTERQSLDHSRKWYFTVGNTKKCALKLVGIDAVRWYAVATAKNIHCIPLLSVLSLKHKGSKAKQKMDFFTPNFQGTR